MSEYQFIYFLALDLPLDDRQLEFMRRQSTRAEISRWEFTNEYHFGDFRGDAREMLRRGYDLHLHYTNFGTRRLMIRLPAGLPCERRTVTSRRRRNWSTCARHWVPNVARRGLERSHRSCAVRTRGAIISSQRCGNRVCWTDQATQHGRSCGWRG